MTDVGVLKAKKVKILNPPSKFPPNQVSTELV